VTEGGMKKKKQSFYDRQVNMRYITRIDRQYQHGWRVRMGQQTLKEVAKFFSDFKYKDEKHTLRAAQQFRNRIAITIFSNRALRVMRKYNNGLRIPFVPGHVIFHRVKRANRTARNGHSFEEFYTAIWHPKPGVEKQKRFSIKKYGCKKAKRLAQEALITNARWGATKK
jgi:hypothetical protein